MTEESFRNLLKSLKPIISRLERYLAEFIGTFTLVLIAAGAVIINDIYSSSLGLIGIAVASGLVVMVMVCAIGNISGAHINPAVTLAMLITQKINALDSMFYVLSQAAGAILASFVLLSIFPDAVTSVKIGTNNLGSGVSLETGIIVEAILTFILVFTILGTAISTQAQTGFAAFAIGMVVLLAILIGGPITGASMNPARSLGPALVSGCWVNQLVYLIGPVIGAMLAGLIHKKVFAEPSFG
jgi:MIP family channel proteins